MNTKKGRLWADDGRAGRLLPWYRILFGTYDFVHTGTEDRSCL